MKKLSKVKLVKAMSRSLGPMPRAKVKPSGKLYNRQKFKKGGSGEN